MINKNSDQNSITLKYASMDVNDPISSPTSDYKPIPSPKGKSKKKPVGALRHLFYFADKTDVVLLTIGGIMALLAGVLYPGT